MSAFPLSAVADEVPMQVAVKVLPKLILVDKEDVACDDTVAREIRILTELADTPGVVELLSWTEGLFDVHLAFAIYTCSLHRYLKQGGLRRPPSGIDDWMPCFCKQLLEALSQVHRKRIVHRDSKTANMLVDMAPSGPISSAVSDRSAPRVVLADFGGACQLEVHVGSKASFRILANAPEATTFQYRAPELFSTKKLRSCSYATDVWAMGVCIVEMDQGILPCGRDLMRSSNMDQIFKDQL